MFLLACLLLCFEGKKTETKIDCPPKNENVPHNSSQGNKLSPSDQILAQTLHTYIQSVLDLFPIGAFRDNETEYYNNFKNLMPVGYLQAQPRGSQNGS